MRARTSVVVCAVLLVTCAGAMPQTKTVKGGYPGGFQYNPYNTSAFIQRFHNVTPDQQHAPGTGQSMIQPTGNQDLQFNAYSGKTYLSGSSFDSGSLVVQPHNSTHNNSKPINYEIGVCYIEVPTAKLVKGLGQIPAGNGSNPELSRIRSCCKGYVRNIYNFKLCEPVCNNECVSGLCTAPEVCTCFPDHVRNSAGFCVPTCPLACQNGNCAGGECLCNAGYTLDDDGKYCKPICQAGCGGTGNCTAPNTCDCKPGYKTTPDGSCRPFCDFCENGDCVSPNECRCRPGYQKTEREDCLPICAQGCGLDRQCIGPNICSSCPNGYDMDNSSGQCIPKCTPGCVNGICTEGNRCTCKLGYELDRNTPGDFRCIPACAGGCVNGVCASPNHCICNLGFVKDFSVKGRSNCVKRLKRSIDFKKANEEVKSGQQENELLLFEIPDYY